MKRLLINSYNQILVMKGFSIFFIFLFYSLGVFLLVSVVDFVE